MGLAHSKLTGWAWVAPGVVSVFLLAGCGVTFRTDGMLSGKHEIIQQLSSDVGDARILKAKTHNGRIVVRPGTSNRCEGTATVRTRSTSGAAAERLAGRVDVRLVRIAGAISIRVKRPRTSGSESVVVDLDIGVPRHLGVDLKTHNGDVLVETLTGPISAESHNGEVSCTGIAGKARVVTHNGEVTAEFARETAPDARFKTHNGGIRVKIPHEFSAKVSLRTHNGRIKTDVPIGVVGAIGSKGNKIEGLIGNGAGSLELESHNGSISIQGKREK
jgi:DUF4097 and DUF4098 domain-containing protein YvlB